MLSRKYANKFHEIMRLDQYIWWLLDSALQNIIFAKLNFEYLTWKLSTDTAFLSQLNVVLKRKFKFKTVFGKRFKKF